MFHFRLIIASIPYFILTDGFLWGFVCYMIIFIKHQVDIVCIAARVSIMAGHTMKQVNTLRWGLQTPFPFYHMCFLVMYCPLSPGSSVTSSTFVMATATRYTSIISLGCSLSEDKYCMCHRMCAVKSREVLTHCADRSCYNQMSVCSTTHPDQRLLTLLLCFTSFFHTCASIR